MSESSSVIQIRNLSKFFQAKPVVLRMSLDIPRGSLFGLLGPNGAGKTTTINLLTGRLRPSSGSISILGMNPWKERVKLFHKVGYLPQTPTHHQDKTVLSFMVYMARLKGSNRRDSIFQARESLYQVGLESFEQHTVGKLSGGETQRLGVANALLGDPEILILDEPTASLDPEGRVYIMDLISKMAHDHSKTVIVSSHILPEIQRMTNNIAIMSEGRVLISGNVRELTQNVFDHEYEIETSHPQELRKKLEDRGYSAKLDVDTVVVTSNGDLTELWEDIPHICVENNYELRSYKPARDALENLFMRLVANKTYENGGTVNE
ncbi:MAG: ABC transporter ATP-binding protein [Candidatus Kariarchaeaceae archaeon]|jgi:ABC-2 type transport system ATP-binding protein